MKYLGGKTIIAKSISAIIGGADRHVIENSLVYFAAVVQSKLTQHSILMK